MKRILKFLALAVFMTSCYSDYIKDFDYSSVYFPYQVNVRTFVVGEGMQIKVGAALGGVMTNKSDRVVSFQLMNNLVTAKLLTDMKASAPLYVRNAVAPLTELIPMPEGYVTLSNTSKFLIKAGEHMGDIVVKADSAKFLADAKTINPVYVLPFYISDAEVDTIIQPKRSAVIGLKYENMLFGNYWHGGITTVKDPSGAVVETKRYYTTIPSPASRVRELKTVAPNALTINGYSDLMTSKAEMKLILSGNNVTIETVPGATVVVKPNGTSTFNRSKLLQDRKIILNYSYVGANGNTYTAQDTLTFRNRIRDGVNEWQDENPGNY